MKRISFYMFWLCLAASAWSGLSAAEWAMFCKGPISITIRKDLSGILSSSGVTITMQFNNPNKKAGNHFENLANGECSWPDRPLRSSERACMMLSYGANVESEFAIEYQLLPSGELRPQLRILGGGITERLSGLKQDGRKMRVITDGYPSCGRVVRIEEVR